MMQEALDMGLGVQISREQIESVQWITVRKGNTQISTAISMGEV